MYNVHFYLSWEDWTCVSICFYSARSFTGKHRTSSVWKDLQSVSIGGGIEGLPSLWSSQLLCVMCETDERLSYLSVSVGVGWYGQLGWGSFQKHELVNLGARKFSLVKKIYIFQCMGKIFCVEFQREPLKFHTKYLAHTLKEAILIHY